MAADEYVMGPPPGYQPRTGDRQLPPEAYESAAERGRALVMKVLADCGIQKSAEGKWTVATPGAAQNDASDGRTADACSPGGSGDSQAADGAHTRPVSGTSDEGNRDDD
jgi:hypothetical protein